MLIAPGIFAFSEDVIYAVKKAVPEGFDPLMYFTFKPVYTFEAYGNSNEHLNGRYDTNPIFDKNAYMLDVNVTGLTSNLSDITEGYELWLLDDMTLAVTYFYNMKVRSKDKFEAVTYRFFMKDGLYKFGYDFEEDAFLGELNILSPKSFAVIRSAIINAMNVNTVKSFPNTRMITMMSASVMNVMIVRIRTNAHSKM